MKLTASLSRHNLYRMMRNQWKVARKRPVLETSALDSLSKHNLEVIDANDYIAPEKLKFDFSSIVGGPAPKEIPKNENHPLYKSEPCYFYRDNSVLLEGLHQALVLTNTVQLEHETLPDQIDKLIDSVQLPDQDKLVKRCIKTSCLYDAVQQKLPVIKDPLRPAMNFPRDYGITDYRKNLMLCNRLLHLCALASPAVSSKRAVLHNAPFSVPLLWGEDNVQLQLRADVFVSSNEPLRPIVSPTEIKDQQGPELSVTHPLISLEEENFYELKDVYPLKEGSKFSNVHTVMIHYNESEVRNMYGTPVTETQILGRSLVKAYTTAVAQARHNYGPSVKDVPEPIVVQCVQTNGRSFHFSVLQLNSADVESSQSNVYWSLPIQDLYEDCSYVKGVPNFQGYSPQVFKHLLAFYVNS